MKRIKDLMDEENVDKARDLEDLNNVSLNQEVVDDGKGRLDGLWEDLKGIRDGLDRVLRYEEVDTEVESAISDAIGSLNFLEPDIEEIQDGYDELADALDDLDGEVEDLYMDK